MSLSTTHGRRIHLGQRRVGALLAALRDQPAPNGAAMPPFVKQEDEVAGFESEAKKEEEDHFRDPQKESVVMLCNVGQVRPPRAPPRLSKKIARCAVRSPAF